MSQSDQTVVLLQEEYGFREWVWWTGMSEKELIAWWSALETANRMVPRGMLHLHIQANDPT